MARFGIAAGHSSRSTGERRFEWERCRAVQERLGDLLIRSGHSIVCPPQSIYDLRNDQALAHKIRLFNEKHVDVALELHLNAGGGDYSTAIYWDSPKRHSVPGRQLADGICTQLGLFLPWRTIGARGKTHFRNADGRSRPMGFLTKTKATSVIVEAAFKDVPEHREWIQSKGFAAEYAALVFLAIQDAVATQ